MAEIVKTPIATKISLTKEAIEAGNVIVPEGYELVKKPDPKQAILDEITQLESMLADIKEPSNEELIELGKMHHPYYDLQNRLQLLNEQLEYGK